MTGDPDRTGGKDEHHGALVGNYIDAMGFGIQTIRFRMPATCNHGKRAGTSLSIKLVLCAAPSAAGWSSARSGPVKCR
jgi:hypothetical protein